MRVECPGCKQQFKVDHCQDVSRRRGELLVQCPHCGLGGRAGAVQSGVEYSQEHLELNSQMTPSTVAEALRTVSFVCPCGFHTDLPEHYRYRMGSCPACMEWVMAGEEAAAPGLTLQALKEVHACSMPWSEMDMPVLQLDRRLAPRIPAVQLTAQLRGLSTKRFPVWNVSSSGIALLSMPASVENAQPVTLKLQEHGDAVLPPVSTRLVRIGSDSAGLVFEGLTMAHRRALRALLARSARYANGMHYAVPSARALRMTQQAVLVA